MTEFSMWVSFAESGGCVHVHIAGGDHRVTYHFKPGVALGLADALNRAAARAASDPFEKVAVELVDEASLVARSVQ